jgi:hypothetical protein
MNVAMPVTLAAVQIALDLNKKKMMIVKILVKTVNSAVVKITSLIKPHIMILAAK